MKVYITDQYMSHQSIVAIANQKGGVGKTTTTVNFAFALQRLGKTVLLVDLDPQSSLSKYFIKDVTQLETTVLDLILKRIPIPPLPIAEGIDLLPANIDLSEAEVRLPVEMNKEKRLVAGLKHYPNYDIILVDCTPSLTALTLNALTAADIILVPVETQILAVRGLPLLTETIENVRESELNPKLRIWKILPTKHNTQTNHAKDMFEAIKLNYDKLVYPLPSKMSNKYNEAASTRVDVSQVSSELGEYWDGLAKTFVREMEVSYGK